MNVVYKSFQNLVQFNNGFFKSEKQAEFLSQYATERDGCIGNLTINKNPVFVELDEKGIVKMYYQSSTKKGYSSVLIFQRVVLGELNEIQIKKIKKLEKEIAKERKEFERIAKSFADGSYNNSGDPSTYMNDEYVVSLYKRGQERRVEKMKNLEQAILKIKNQAE